MKITVLGSGASAGVPLLGCTCPVCISDDPKNKRSRVSIVVERHGKRILIDTSPDLRQQCLKHNITTVDAILYTHAHADHVHGIDDVRSLNFHKDAVIPCYGDEVTLNDLQHRFAYAFQQPISQYGWFRPAMQPHVITPNQPFEVAGMTVTPFTQSHGSSDSLGFRIGGFVYSTDVKSFPAESEPYLQGMDCWLVDCLRYSEAPTHAHLELTLEWIETYKPKQAFLTHLSHDFDYDDLNRKTPHHVQPAYDGLAVAC